jgi:hypothetical protein
MTPRTNRTPKPARSKRAGLFLAHPFHHPLAPRRT